MNLNQMRYILAESVMMQGRQRAANIVSVAIMGLSLLILLVFILVTLNIGGVISGELEKTRVYVYLDGGEGGEPSGDIQLRLLGLEGIEEVVFISRGEALSSAREWLGEGKDLLEELEGNPLPDSYRVKLKPDFINSAFMERLAAGVAGWEGVEEVRYGRRWFERGEKLVRGFFLTDLVLGLIIFLSVVFVISNTVRLTVLSRQRSIEIMKLVGATNAYIQVPFIIEGALQGIVASLFAMGLLGVIYVFGSRYLHGISFFGGEWVAGFTLFCALLGAAGSYAAMRRFLKV